MTDYGHISDTLKYSLGPDWQLNLDPSNGRYVFSVYAKHEHKEHIAEVATKIIQDTGVYKNVMNFQLTRIKELEVKTFALEKKLEQIKQIISNK